MSRHIRKWQAEHANYRRLLDLLRAETARFAAGGRPDYELMSDVVHYMTQYPDVFHHPREDVAFGRLVARDAGAQGIVEALGGQHRTIAASGATLAADLAAAAAGMMMPRATLEADVHRYAALLEGHMTQEEREIFPRLAAALDEGDWFLVDAAIHFAADPVFGERVHERYRALHRHIVRRAGCICEEPLEQACCLD